MRVASDFGEAVLLTDPDTFVYDFRASPTLEDFLHDDSDVRVLVGPFGGGKSYACCFDIMARAQATPPCPRDNIRYFRCLVARNTYDELLGTTMKTWLEVWKPEIWGRATFGNLPEHVIHCEPEGGEPGLHLEVQFRAFDRIKDLRKMLSREVSMVWMNEARELPEALLDVATGRIRRYPAVKDRTPGAHYWFGIILDTNPYDDMSWMARLERERPQGYAFFRQPPAVLEVREKSDGVYESVELDVPDLQFGPGELIEQGERLWAVNPAAENLPHLDERYYESQIAGKSVAYIRCYLQGRNVYVQEGEPVIPEFNEAACVRDELPILETELQLWVDCGGGTLNNAFIVAQRHPSRPAWFVHFELYCPNMGLAQACETLDLALRERFGERASSIRLGWGDPAGSTRDGVYERTAFDILRDHGYRIRGAPDKSVQGRIEAIKAPLNRSIDGRPGFQVHRSCTRLIRGLAGRWRYREYESTTGPKFSPEPVKDEWSHLCDALGYGLLGAGEHKELTHGRRRREREEVEARWPRRSPTPEPKSNVRIKPWGRR